MITSASAEHCLSFIHTQLQPHGKPGETTAKQVHRAVTISRQTGCGAAAIAAKLAEYLQQHAAGENRPWTVFDRNLIDKVLEDHNLPHRLAKSLHEDRASQLEEILADVFDVRPSVPTVIQQATETMHRLAAQGNVIIVGWGSNVLMAKMPQVLHVRLVASLAMRVEHVRQAHKLTESEAHKFCVTEDRARERYFRKYLDADINDPLLYHLIINTGWLGYEGAAKLIGDTVLNLPVE
ncbi:MAG TPA: cytidylate kinase-like family protein [Candidatus Acidoferrum sp.]|nr:cytidylate kinase-like family protein [Candidatus Acidoferrum sp.]